MKNKETMAERIKEKYSLTSISKKFNTDLAYVSQIARGGGDCLPETKD